MIERQPETSPLAFAKTFLGIEPHPSQARWLETRAKVKTACCGRRWGKSFSEAIDLLWFAFAFPGTRQFLFAPTADQSRIIMGYAETMLMSGHARRYATASRDGRFLRESPFPELRFVNGSSIHARTAGKTGVPSRGHGADRVLLDEAAFIPEPIVINTILPFLANSEFAERVNVSTPFGRNHFFEDFRRGEAGEPGYASARYPSSDSPFVSSEYLDRQRLEMTTLQFDVEYEALFAEDQNAVFPYSLIQSCLDPIIDLDAPPDPAHRYVIGYDPAKWQDRSGVVALDITEKPWRVAEVLDISGRDYLVQAGEIARLSADYGKARVLLDATSHDQMLEQLKRDRVPAEGFKFTNESKQELINGLVIAMEQGNIRLPNHRDLINELTYYRYELTAAGNVRLGADEKHHDDLVTALALAVRANSGPDLPYAYLRNDPEFRAEVLGAIAQDTETADDRIARRRAALGL